MTVHILFAKENRATGEQGKSLQLEASDHSYALPANPKVIKAKLSAASARVKKLHREKMNALARERRAKKNMQALLEELNDKNLLNEELKDKLESYSGKLNIDIKCFVNEMYFVGLLIYSLKKRLPVLLLSRQSAQHTKPQRDFPFTLF